MSQGVADVSVPALHSQHYEDGVWWYIPVLPNLEQKEQKFKVTLGYTEAEGKSGLYDFQK